MTETNLENWEEMKKNLESGGSSTLPQQITGKIVEVKTMTAGEIFGESVRPFENETKEQAKAKPMVMVTCDTGYEFDVRESFAPFLSPKSKLGQFRAYYKQLPEVGMQVQLIKRPGKDGRNYYRILF